MHKFCSLVVSRRGQVVKPIAGFKHLRPEHKILLPKVTLDQVEAYYFTLYMISLSQLVMAEI
jgi:hypothetical protein